MRLKKPGGDAIFRSVQQACRVTTGLRGHNPRLACVKGIYVQAYDNYSEFSAQMFDLFVSRRVSPFAGAIIQVGVNQHDDGEI